MKKKTGHKNLGKLSFLGHIPYWVFLVLLLVSVAICVSALRSNNQTMIELRNAVYEADENGENVEEPLNELRQYVYAHMNTDLSSGGNAIKPPIQLKYTYERLQAVEDKRVDKENEAVYTRAQAYCEQQNSSAFSGRSRVPCIEEYVTTHGAKATEIPPALYQYDFISPMWSPDLAGWSLVISAVLFFAFLGSFLIDRMVKSKIDEF